MIAMDILFNIDEFVQHIRSPTSRYLYSTLRQARSSPYINRHSR